ncbi:hypothetical protein [Brevifollis gellanilyticus]|uniref:Uncharacterized protein n=1 Tax=Brevifollis gellanilyticus TaxID=748831 RepID=A0A512MBZ3_9BACT|nr:hypothetical protein [Brevifollis gellanilyticus]GEP44232.1 hypothetical protein BGE01nite_35230 [Brevifollis gellanilyticus]
MLNQPSDTSPSSLKEPLEDILFKLRFHAVLDCWFEALKPLLKQLIPYLHTDPRCRGVLLEMLELYEYDSSFPHEVADLLLDHFPEDPGVRRFMQIFGLSSYGDDGMVSQSVHKLCYRRQIDPAFWLAQAVHGSLGRYWPSRRSGCTGKDHTSICEDIVDHQLAKGESRLFPVWVARTSCWNTIDRRDSWSDKLEVFDLKKGWRDYRDAVPPESSSNLVNEPTWLSGNSRRARPESEESLSLAQIFESVITKVAPELEPLLVLAQVDRSPQTRDYLLDEWQKLDSKSQSRRLLTLFLAWKFADDPVVAPALSGANELSAYRDGIDPLQIHLADPDFSKCSQDDALWEPLMQSLHHARGNKLYRFLNTIGRLILRFGRQERARDELIKRLKASGEPYLANAALKEYDGHWEVDVAVLSLEALALCWPDHPETREMVETAVYSPVERIQDIAACLLGRIYRGDGWADALLRSALMESSDFLAEYLVRNLGREEVVDEAFALMERLPDQWEHSHLYESAPQCVIAFFGPRYDLLERLAALMKRTPHKEMKESIADLLITYSSQCEQGGLVSPWEECRLRAIRAQHPDVSQYEFVPLLKKMALNDPVMEVRLAALGKLLTKDEAKVFAAEVVVELVMEGEFRATELLCSAKAGDENLAAWLTSFAPGSPFCGPCEELFHLLKTYFLRTKATRDYMRGMLRKDLAAKELNAHLWLLTVDLGDIEFLCLEFDRWIHEKRLRFYILARLMDGYMKTMSRLERVNTIERLVTGRDFAGRHHLVTALLMMLQPLRVETRDELSDSDLARVEALIDDLLTRAPLAIRLGLHRVIERRATRQDSERWWAFYLNSLFPMLAEVDKEAEKTAHTSR